MSSKSNRTHFFSKIGGSRKGIKTVLLVSLCFLCNDALLAQSTALQGYQSSIIPPSPNASALGKFVDQPVNLYTGIPQINVPIYSWASPNSGLSLNLSLDYHAGGAKVEEEASNIGLGWALNAGGAITRIMRGKPDEYFNGFSSTPVLPNIETSSFDGGFTRTNRTYNADFAVTSENSSSFELVKNLNENSVDALQDIFLFNFNGRSGKFFIGKDGSIAIQTKDNLKIAKIQDQGSLQIRAFEVIDETGVLYHFEERETTQLFTLTTTRSELGISTTNGGGDFPYTSSWFLSYIKSADRQSTISFTYQNSQQRYRAGFNETKSIDLFEGPISNLPSEETTESSSTYWIEGKRLSTIEFPDQVTVAFGYAANERQDLERDHALNKITISQKGESFGFNLVQSYLVSGGSADPYSNSRLMLDQVYRFAGQNTEQPYKFFYDGGLPSKDSMYQDFWGYAVSNRSINSRIPKMDVTDASGTLGNRFSYLYQGADRSPDSVAVKGGALYKIVYPTGGSAVYQMEVNKAFSPAYSTNREKLNYTFNYSHVNQDMGLMVSPTAVLSASFRIAVVETYRQVNEPGMPVDYIENDIDDNPVTITLTKGTWSTVLYSGNYGAIHNLPYFWVNNIALPGTGEYRLRISMKTGYPIAFDLSYGMEYQVAPTDKPVGGLRVKKIETFLADSPSGTPVLSKTFNYQLPDGKSSGKLPTIPNYGYYGITKITQDVPGEGFNGVYHDMLVRNSSSTHPLGAIQGSPIGYEYVTVTEVGPTSNGKKIYEFSPLVAFDASFIYPFKAGEHISWGAGLPLKERSYDATGKLVEQTDYQYDIACGRLNNENHRSLCVGQAMQFVGGPPLQNIYLAQQSYPIVGNSLKMRSTVHSFSTGVQQIDKLQVTDFTYNTKYQQKEIISAQSMGRKTIRYYYPQDYTGNSVMQAMVNANRIAAPVREEEWTVKPSDSLLTALRITDYTADRDPLGFIRIAAKYSLKDPSPLSAASVGPLNAATILTPADKLVQDIKFNQYLSNGAVRVFSRENSPNTALLWSSDNKELMANVANADQNEIFREDFETTGNSTAHAHDGLKANSGNYTPSFSPPNNKQYLISYWKFDGTDWKWYGNIDFTGQTLTGEIDDVLIYPKDGQATSYTYKPLAGVSSSTDPKGMTTYYEYDAFQRLKAIKDQNGNILKQTEYHYKN